MGRLLEAARASGAEAVHPGYGFLSENWRFARACEEAGLVWIGPPWPVIRDMGDKVGARRLMAAAGVPVVPGSEGVVETADAAREAAARVGYPVFLKAAAGGGGIGMARVADESALAGAFATAQRRSQAAFGTAALFVERFLEAPRHIEVQVMGDRHGGVVHLHERECSIQRRHQKLIEETPAPGLSAALKERLTAAAVSGARAVGYVNAGTMEFIVQGEEFYFLEMNTRLQVEHPVTEEVTGVDLVQAQLRVASGEPLPWAQHEIVQRGREHRVPHLRGGSREEFPALARADHAARAARRARESASSAASPKASRCRSTTTRSSPSWWRRERRGRRPSPGCEGALDGFLVEGVKTVIPFHRRVLASDAFRAGTVHTQMVDQGAFR